jgi:hypothetical protein
MSYLLPAAELSAMLQACRDPVYQKNIPLVQYSYCADIYLPLRENHGILKKNRDISNGDQYGHA